MATNNAKKFFISKTDKDNLLEMKYYCVARNEQVDVVIELKGDDAITQSVLPQRYVLVLDVSGSMDSTPVEGDTRTLLERMKVFAKLFIAHVSSNTFISIVDFSDKARILLPMTKMNKDGKAKADKIITNLHTIGLTNLSAGLITGLETTKSSRRYPQSKSHDCMILFTDGSATCGELDSVKLAKSYDNTMKRLNRVNKVQLVLITIGNYRPQLLKDITLRFSSDSFYWLNFESDFEADMLIPVFLRKKTALTDLTINLKCLNGVKFVENSASTAGLQKLESGQALQYFIYHLPRSITKTIYFKLNIAKKHEIKDKILSANISYLDHKLNQQRKRFDLLLSMTSMKDLVAKEDEKEGTVLVHKNLETLMKISAFSVSDEGLIASWQNAQVSFAYVMKQLSRQTVISALNQAIDYLDNEEEVNVQYFQQVTVKFNEIKDETADVLGLESLFYKDFLTSVHPFADILQFILQSHEDITWIQLTAMESSLNMEMPAATGVFSKEAERLFMPLYVKNELDRYVKKIRCDFRNQEPKKPDSKKLEREISAFINRCYKAIKERKIKTIKTKEMANIQKKINELEYFIAPGSQLKTKIITFRTNLRAIENVMKRMGARR